MMGFEEEGFLSTGVLLKNQFQITKNLSVTELSRNYLALDKHTNKQVFVKELLDTFHDPAKRDQAIKQFRIEAQILIGLMHPGIPSFRDYFEHNTRRYIVMDYVDGKSLFDHVKDSRDFFDEKAILTWALELCYILNYLHNRKPNPVIFRALSPKNIILSREKKLYLTDFGISKTFTPASKTIAAAKMANPNFSPIEQYTGLTDVRTDIYSLGATLYYVITRVLPVDALQRLRKVALPPCREYNTNFSQEIECIVLKAMELDKEDRYQAVQEMQIAFKNIFDKKYRLHSSSAPKTRVLGGISPEKSIPLPVGTSKRTSRLFDLDSGKSTKPLDDKSVTPSLSLPRPTTDEQIRQSLSKPSLSSSGGPSSAEEVRQSLLKPSHQISPSGQSASDEQSRQSLAKLFQKIGERSRLSKDEKIQQSSPRKSYDTVVSSIEDSIERRNVPSRPEASDKEKILLPSRRSIPEEKSEERPGISSLVSSGRGHSRSTRPLTEIMEENEGVKKVPQDIKSHGLASGQVDHRLKAPFNGSSSAPVHSRLKPPFSRSSLEQSDISSTSEPVDRVKNIISRTAEIREEHSSFDRKDRFSRTTEIKGGISSSDIQNKLSISGTPGKISFPASPGGIGSKVPLYESSGKGTGRPAGIPRGKASLTQDRSLRRVQTRRLSSDVLASLPDRKSLLPEEKAKKFPYVPGKREEIERKDIPSVSFKEPSLAFERDKKDEDLKGKELIGTAEREEVEHITSSVSVISEPLSPGVIVNDRYKVICLLDEGQSTRTYRAMDNKNNCHVALKELLDRFDDPVKRRDAILQFQVEAKILIALEHPAIPRFEEYFSYNNRRYFVIDFVEGDALDKIIQTSPLYDELQLLEWSIQLVNIIDYMHSQKPEPVIFRDMCPKNVILSSEGKLKIIDFGISKLFSPEAKTASVAKTVNPSYSPVEQYVGQTDQKSDIYSLGATIYFLVTRTIPVDAIDRSINDTPLTPCHRFNANISSEFEQIILKAMGLNKVDRYDNIKEMKIALEEVYKKVRKARSLSSTGERSSLKTPETAKLKPMYIKKKDTIVTEDSTKKIQKIVERPGLFKRFWLIFVIILFLICAGILIFIKPGGIINFLLKLLHLNK